MLLRQRRRVLLRHRRQGTVGSKLEPHETRYGWGTAASPVLYEDRLYIVNDNDEESYLLALDAKTGEEIWRSRRATRRATGPRRSSGRTTSAPRSSRRARARCAPTISTASCSGSSAACRASRSPRRTRTTDCSTSAPATCWTSCGRSTRFGPARRATSRCRTSRRPTSSSPGANRRPRPTTRRSLIYGDRLYVLYDRGFFACLRRRTTAKRFTSKQRLPERQGVHRVALGLRRQDLLPQRRRRDVRASRPATSSRCCTPTRWPRTTCAWRRRRSRATGC